MDIAEKLDIIQEHLNVLFDFSRVPIRIFSPQREVLLAVPQETEFWIGLPLREDIEHRAKGDIPRLVSLPPNLILGYFPIKGAMEYEVAVGPVYVFNQPFLPLEQMKQSPLSPEKISLLPRNLPSVSVEGFCAYLRLLVKCLGKKDVSVTEILEENFPVDAQQDVREELFSHLYSEREEPIYHSPYQAEKLFIRNIQNGNLEAVEAAIKKTKDFDIGTLSRDPFRQICYISIALVTLVTRAAIEGGMDETFAFHLSDIYIQHMDAATSNKEIIDIAIRLLQDFTLRMRDLKTQGNYSKPVAKAIHYIRLNLHNPMTVPQIAEHVGLSADHLSRVFRRETGELLSSYIQRERIEEAKDALRFSSYSSLQISNVLCFSSQSYFNQIFKKYTGLTPAEYRKKYQ